MRNLTVSELIYLDDMESLVKAIRKSLREGNYLAAQAYSDDLHEAMIGLWSVNR